jgi:hypothetical protein
LPISYGINFGVSEAEIEEFLNKEIYSFDSSLADLNPTIGLKEFLEKTERDWTSFIKERTKFNNELLDLDNAFNELGSYERGLVTPDWGRGIKTKEEVENIFNNTEVLKNYSSFAEIAEMDKEYEKKKIFKERWEKHFEELKVQNREISSKLKELDYLKKGFAEIIEAVKGVISESGLTAGEIYDYSSPQHKAMLRGWLNYLGWKYSLNSDKFEVERQIKADIRSLCKIAEEKKKSFEEVKGKVSSAGFSDEYWEDFKKQIASLELEWNEWKMSLNEESHWKLYYKATSVEREAEVRSISSRIEKSLNSSLLTEVLNELAEKESGEESWLEKDITWQEWIRKEVRASGIRDKLYEVNKVFEKCIGEENIKERTKIEFSASREDYELLGLSESASEEEIRKRYKKLALEFHPDKRGGSEEDEEKWKEIQAVYKKISEKSNERAKYDFCLAEDDELGYANWKKWKQIKRENKLADEKFLEKIRLILSEEFRRRELTAQKVTDYDFEIKEEAEEVSALLKDDEELAKFWQEGEHGLEFREVEDFFALKEDGVLGAYQYQVIEYARNYLLVIDKTFNRWGMLRTLVSLKTHYKLEEIEELLEGKGLTAEEINEPGKADYARSYEKALVEMLWTKKTTSQGQSAKEAVKKAYDEAFGRLCEVKSARKELLVKVNEKIEFGRDLLVSKDPAEIAEFLVQFKEFIDQLSSPEGYEVELKSNKVIGEVSDDEDEDLREVNELRVRRGLPKRKKKILGEVINKIVVNQELTKRILEENGADKLIKDLEEVVKKAKENEEVERVEEINEIPTLAQTEPITEEQKKTILDYLNDLVFELAPSHKKTKNPANLRYIKNTILGPELDYEKPLKDANNWEQVEDIRHKAVKNICGIIKGGGGSDDALTARVERILKNLALALEKEITEKVELSPEQKRMLVVDFQSGTNNSARKLTESKRKILSEISKKNQEEETSAEPEETDFPEQTEEENILPEQATNQNETDPPLDRPKSDREWKNISLDFNEGLKGAWEAKGFNYYQAKDWIEIGAKVDEHSFCAWLRDDIKLNPEQILNNLSQEKIAELREQYTKAKHQGQKLSTWEEAWQESETQRERERDCLLAEINKLELVLTELEQISSGYWKTSQEEIKEWKNEAETHLEALRITETWNKNKWDRLEEEKQNLIEIINQKNNELDELEAEADLTDFQNSRENSQQINLIQEEIEELRTQLTQLHQHYQDRLTHTRAEIIRLGEETNTLNQELSQEEALVDLKDRRIDDLTESTQKQAIKINHLNRSGLRKQKTIIELSQQLIQDQTKIKDLTKLLTASEKKAQRLEKQLAIKNKKLNRTKTNQQNRTNNLQQKITNLGRQKTNLTNELADLEVTAQTYYQTSQQNLADTQQELENAQTGQIQAERERDARADITPADLQTLRDDLTTATQARNQTQGQLTYYQTQDEGLRNTIINLQTQLANQQNLNQTLQNQINNHTCPALPVHVCPPCPLVHLPEPHVCPIVQQVNQTSCSHADYDNLKTELKILNQEKAQTQSERNQALKERNDYQSQLSQMEQKIVQQLNASFKLGLAENEKDLNQAILKIQRLIAKDPLIETVDNPTLQKELDQAQQTITLLQQQLANANNNQFEQNNSNLSSPAESEFAEVKQDLCQQFSKSFPDSLSQETIQQLQQSTSYQQLVNAQQQAFKQIQGNELAKEKQQLSLQLEAQPKPTERIILISLLVVSLVSIGGLLVRLKTLKKR